MNLTGGHSGELSPDAVRTGIDAVLYEEFTRERQPGDVRAEDSFYFKQGPTVGVSFIHDEDVGVGDFDEVGEQEEFLNTDSFIGNQVTRNSQKYYKQVPVSDEAFRADMVGKRERIGTDIGRHARQTQDKKAMTNTYGDAFAGSVFTTPDGQPLASSSHVSLKGATVDNLETGSLTPDNLWTLVNSLANQKGQDGDAGSHLFEGFLSNFLLYKTAKEIMSSSLLANSAENNLNVFDTDYGQVRIGASIFLGSSYNNVTNANTSYHIMSRDHQVLRKVFYGLNTDMKTPHETNNDSYAYVAKFHEVCFPGTWTGYAGSNGST
jgi:hypothetical protein